MKHIFKILTLAAVMSMPCCKKTSGNTDNNPGGTNPGGGNPGGGGTNQPPVDPPTASTIGFFLNDWEPKNFTVPSYTDTTAASGTASSFVTIDASKIITKIPKTIFGQNANLWMSQMVTETPLMTHLNNLHPDPIRF